MLTRLLIVALLFAAGYLLYLWYTRRQVQRITAMPADPILAGLRPGIPAIVYFTTPHCIPCRTQQQPALAELHRVLGEDRIQIIKIDATEDPEAADRWGVFSAPTTFVVDANGRTHAVNHGVADAVKLQKQLALTA